MPTYPFAAAVYIGRFQPVHLGHLQTLQTALKIAKHVVVVLGSHQAARSSWRNPWTSQERTEMLQRAILKKDRARVHFIPIRDRLYNEEIWKNNILTELNRFLDMATQDTPYNVVLLGHNKDASSYYLSLFPQWEFVETGNHDGYNSTDFRTQYFSRNFSTKDYYPLHKTTKKWLTKFRKTKEFRSLQKEHEEILVLQEKYKATKAANVVVHCQGYILLIRRKKNPGKGLWALPGGAMDAEDNNDFLRTAQRELSEETNLSLPIYKTQPKQKDTSMPYLFVQQEAFFDHPYRSALGIQAHTYFCALETTPCPQVYPGDDAQKAAWFLLEDVWNMEHKLFSDHFQMLQYFFLWKPHG